MASAGNSAKDFDPYYAWLGVPPSEARPINAYRLLGLQLFEPDPQVIESAADKQMGYVQTFKTGLHSVQSQQILNELSHARVTLLNPAKRQAYDTALRAQAAPATATIPVPASSDVFAVAPIAAPVAAPAAARPAVARPVAGKAQPVGPVPNPFANPPQRAAGASSLSHVASASTNTVPGKPVPGKPGIPPLVMLGIGGGAVVVLMIIGLVLMGGSSKSGKLTLAASTTARPYSVQIDGKPISLAADGSMQSLVTPGKHRVVVSRADFYDFDQELIVAPGAQVEITPTWVPSASVTLEFPFSDPQVVRDEFDGKVQYELDGQVVKAEAIVVGTSPLLVDFEVDPGPHTLRGSRADQRFELRFDAVSGKPLTLRPQWQLTAAPAATPAATSLAPVASLAPEVTTPEAMPVEQPTVVQPPVAVVEATRPPVVVNTPPDMPASPEPSPAAVQRLAVPSKADQDKALELLLSVLGDELKQAETAPAHVEAAKKLLELAEQDHEATHRYVMWTQAQQQAVLGQDYGLALDALDLIAANFEVDKWPQITQLLQQSESDAKFTSQRKNLLAAARQAAERAVAEDQFDTALALLAVAENAATKGRFTAERKEVQTRIADLAAEQKAFAAIPHARATLDQQPDDPTANETLGRYLCETRFDFDAGLPHLARGPYSPLKELAAKDAAGPATDAEQMALADAWWEFSQRQEQSPQAKRAWMVRAGQWYEQVLPRTSGLGKVKAESRLKEIEPLVPSIDATAALVTKTVRTKSASAKKLPPNKVIDLLRTIDRTNIVQVKGEITVSADQIEFPKLGFARAQLPIDPGESYELSMHVTRLDGDDAVLVHLPMGNTSCWLSAGGSSNRGGKSYLELVDNTPAADNRSARDGRVIKTGTKMLMQISVEKVADKTFRVTFTLDGRQLIQPTVQESQLSMNMPWDIPNHRCLGLGSHNSSARFENIQLRSQNASLVDSPAPVRADNVVPIPTNNPPKASVTPLSPGVLPLNGLAGGKVVQCNVPPQWARPGVFAEIDGEGTIEAAAVPVPWYVLETDLVVHTRQTMLKIHLGENGFGTELCIGGKWNGADNDPQLPTRLFKVLYSTVYWGGTTSLPVGEPLKLKLVVSNHEKALLFNDKRIAGSQGEATDFRLKIVSNREAKVSILRCEARPITPADVEPLGWPMPVETPPLEGGVSLQEIERRNQGLKRQPVIGMPFQVPTNMSSLLWVEPGQVQLGAGTDGPTLPVNITRGFWLGRYEMNQAGWSKLMKDPSRIKGPGLLPVHWVSLAEVMEFCQKLNQSEGRQNRIPAGYEYRPPTEAEWEYVCRAGTTGKFNVAEDQIWHAKTSNGSIQLVGQKTPNPWGFYDMHGNVPEWCLDRHQDYIPSATPVADRLITGKPNDSFVLRGGSWYHNLNDCSTTARSRGNASQGTAYWGFRLALAPVLTPQQ